MRTVMDAGITGGIPNWVPDEVRRYLAHTTSGKSIRSLAREAGCHASTVLRQVRRYESRRDDLLVDLALRRLGEAARAAPANEFKDPSMSYIESVEAEMLPEEEEIRREAPRILRRLNETGACLAIAREMEKAVVVRETGDGRTLRTAVLERPLAEALALKDWIAVASEGRITRYRITAAGRMALKRLLAEEEGRRAGLGGEAAPFADQHRIMGMRSDSDGSGRRRMVRYNATESPLLSLARRRDKDGSPFLAPDLVAAGERLREDFELAQLGPRVAQNWERFMTGGARGDFMSGGGGGGSSKARERVAAALRDLGPGLGDVVLRCCCFLEGMEAVERRMNWSARSGKVVLRIALTRLKAHYDECGGDWSPLIG